MKKQPLESILEKRCSFLLADIDIFIDCLLLEKRKTEGCRVDSCRFSIFKKAREKQHEKNDCPFHQMKKCQKRKYSFGLCSFYIHGKERAERCASNKGKFELWCQYHIRAHKGWKIYRFLSNQKRFWRFCMGRMFEAFQQEKKFKMVLFGFSENNCHEYWFGSMWAMFNIESFKLYIL